MEHSGCENRKMSHDKVVGFFYTRGHWEVAVFLGDKNMSWLAGFRGFFSVRNNGLLLECYFCRSALLTDICTHIADNVCFSFILNKEAIWWLLNSDISLLLCTEFYL